MIFIRLSPYTIAQENSFITRRQLQLTSYFNYKIDNEVSKEFNQQDRSDTYADWYSATQLTDLMNWT